MDGRLGEPDQAPRVSWTPWPSGACQASPESPLQPGQHSPSRQRRTSLVTGATLASPDGHLQQDGLVGQEEQVQERQHVREPVWLTGQLRATAVRAGHQAQGPGHIQHHL